VRIGGRQQVAPRGEDLAELDERGTRLGLVTLAQMVSALVRAVENPVRGIRIVEVPAIRAAEGA
jgi:hypothetical protein